MEQIKNQIYDIVIVGGGHAGLEACNIACQFNLKIALITMPGVGLGSAPCNPAIGGVGKGQVVREVDALGGVMGYLADQAGIQFRTLNDSKGYAVRSSRVQIDKELYSKFATNYFESITNLDIIYQKLESVSKTLDGNFSLKTDGQNILTKKVIVTVGTFLRGKLHMGLESRSGGRWDAEESNSLSDIFKDIKIAPQRFKTGTPARIHKESLDYSVMVEQPSDNTVRNFSFKNQTKARNLKQISCYLTRTSSATIDKISENKHLSPMYNGQIKAMGARYCPSIEDKVVRYPHKADHHVFVEPEGLEIGTVYPSGVSSSLPKEVQLEFLRTINGFENCSIDKYGYAVEYDVVDTTTLSKTLESKEIAGLYFAGQVNGTSGYEEAAGQGFIAGSNAALSLKGLEPLILDRNDSYIGVMIEDLVSNTRDEPYRLFTARSENRLFIREDNTNLRMLKYRQQLCLNQDIDSYNNHFMQYFTFLSRNCDENFISPTNQFLIANNIYIPRRISVSELLKQANLDPVFIFKSYLDHIGLKVPREIYECVAISKKYEGYITKAQLSYEKVGKIDNKNISWTQLCDSHNISFECKQRIQKIKPETFGQLKLIEGIRPATLAVVASESY